MEPAGVNRPQYWGMDKEACRVLSHLVKEGQVLPPAPVRVGPVSLRQAGDDHILPDPEHTPGQEPHMKDEPQRRHLAAPTHGSWMKAPLPCHTAVTTGRWQRLGLETKYTKGVQVTRGKAAAGIMSPGGLDARREGGHVYGDQIVRFSHRVRLESFVELSHLCQWTGRF